MKQLFVSDPTVNGAELATTFRYADREYLYGFRFPFQLKNDPLIHHLYRYLAIINCGRFYDIDYFDEIIADFELSELEIDYLEQTLFYGLAEFRFENNIPITAPVKIRARQPAGAAHPATDRPNLSGAIVMNGGGKDGAVGAEIAKQLGVPFSWFSLKRSDTRQAIVDASGIREWDVASRYGLSVKDLHGQYHGHRPLSAALALLGCVDAYHRNRAYVIVSNEYSSSFDNLTVDGVSINHQFSKSFRHEQMLQNMFRSIGFPVQYFSIVRPLYELQILKLFAGFSQYHKIFISCNHGTNEGFWCFSCSKCAFVMLGLAAVAPASLETIWGDKAVLAKPSLYPHILALVNDSPKPFECVGTKQECRLALRLAADNGMLATIPDVQRAELIAFASSDKNKDWQEVMQQTHRDNAYPAEISDAIFAVIEQLLNQ